MIESSNVTMVDTMIDEIEFKSIMQILVTQLVKALERQKNISEQEAITILYSSLLYSKLENEKTKLWHLSVPALLELLEQELKTGRIDFPEEA
jgi:hypothetical protein